MLPSSMVIAGLIVLVMLLVGGIIYLSKSLKSDEVASISMRKAFNAVTDAVVIISKDGVVRYTNTSAAQLLRCDLRSMMGKRFWDLYKFVDIQSKRVIVSDLSSLLSNKKDKFLLQLSQNQEVAVSCKVKELDFDELGEDSIAIILKDISELRILESRLRILETYDNLTRLPNRRAVESHIKVAITDARKHESKHVFCYIALDQYKYFTDIAGHAAGDELIKQLANELRSMMRPDDILARLNGDEFGILYREVEPKPALELIRQVCQNITKFEFKWMGEKYKFTSSVGYYLIHKGIYTTTQVLYDADLASKVAREKGGNRIYVYRANDECVSARKGTIVWGRRLKTAFEDNLFQLFAQPIHPLEAEEFAKPFWHYEVLIRMHNREGEWVSPGEFLPAAEQHNMMLLIDKWVVAEVVKHIKLVADIKPLPVFSVNLSGHSLSNTHFLDYVLHVLKKSQVNPHMICFEVTETVAVNDLNLATKFISTLRQLGCSFSLDDFGTGVSTYGYLKSLEVNYLKIDGSFVKDMASDPVSYEMVRSINQVGHVMGLEVIAEYVENDQIVELLREIGVNHGQGYGIAKPEPIENVIKRHLSRPESNEGTRAVKRVKPQSVKPSREVVKVQL